VCRTDLHVVDGELPGPTLPIVPGHQIVGTVDALGSGVTALSVGDRVGLPWLGTACGVCSYCTSDRENLCRAARFTGFQRDGGFAEACVADARFVLRVPTAYAAVAAAPLLCGALIGYRALRLAGDGHRLGLYGFGSAGHMVAQVARHLGREVYAFTRPGDARAQAFAREVGATWARWAWSRLPRRWAARVRCARSSWFTASHRHRRRLQRYSPSTASRTPARGERVVLG
jgi:propanol-preferring alcohol dehydrogenase